MKDKDHKDDQSEDRLTDIELVGADSRLQIDLNLHESIADLHMYPNKFEALQSEKEESRENVLEKHLQFNNQGEDEWNNVGTFQRNTE